MTPTVSGLSWPNAGQETSSNRSTKNFFTKISLSFHAAIRTPERRRGGKAPCPAGERQERERQQVGRHVHEERRDVDAARLQLELRGFRRAEEERARRRGPGVPAREHDERESDEAAPARHALDR